jgi:hypothetical protein
MNTEWPETTEIETNPSCPGLLCLEIFFAETEFGHSEFSDERLDGNARQ